MKARDDIPPLEVRRLFDLDSERGVLIWRVVPRSYLLGRDAGSLNKGTGYIQVSINSRAYLAHRLIWAHLNGVWPNGDIDHIDRVKTNNRPSNLREATRSQNCSNRPANKTNLLGLRGVQATKHGRYRAIICIGGTNKHLGVFATKEEASRAYQAASIEMVGEFTYIAA